jgi:hypothetical protein
LLNPAAASCSNGSTWDDVHRLEMALPFSEVAVLEGAVLEGAVLEGAVLEGAVAQLKAD